MIVERSKLYEILRSQLHGAYSIGLHGIDPYRLDTNDGFPSETKLFDNSIYISKLDKKEKNIFSSLFRSSLSISFLGLLLYVLLVFLVHLLLFDFQILSNEC